MTKSGTLKVVGLIVLVLLLAAAYVLWPVLVPKVEQKAGNIGLTPNEIAANGPLSGDVLLYAKELACQEKLQTGYYPSLNGAEVADAVRSGIYPCATFTGAYSEPNKVFAYRAEDGYVLASYLNNRKPGEIYIVGGVSAVTSGPLSAGPYIAKADSATGKQIWRTYLWNGNTNDAWLGNTNLNILPNGNIVEAWSNRIALVDGNTGLVLKANTIPSGPAAPIDVNFKHVTMAPDGTLLVKDQVRPAGCKMQGTLAIMFCPPQFKQANSELVAISPETLEVLDAVEMPVSSSVPHTITMFEGKIAIYIGENNGALRYFWDPKARKLSQDKSWVPVVLKEGQTTPAAPSILGDWIIFQTDGIFTDKTASSIVAVSQKDASKVTVIFPFGQLKPGEMSFCMPKPEVDPENNMIYSADFGLRKVAGIKIDQATGELKPVFVLDDMTSGFQPLYGSPDKRVLVISNAKSNVPGLGLKELLATHNYKEQVTWRDAATGRILAESDFFEPMGLNGLIVPGFGGRAYYPTDTGIIILQVVPVASLAAKK